MKNCSFEGCSNKVQLGGACITHIAMRETVQSRWMYQQVIKGGVCVAHGAKLQRCCSHEGCIWGGVCLTHGTKGTIKIDAAMRDMM